MIVLSPPLRVNTTAPVGAAVPGRRSAGRRARRSAPGPDRTAWHKAGQDRAGAALDGCVLEHHPPPPPPPPLPRQLDATLPRASRRSPTSAAGPVTAGAAPGPGLCKRLGLHKPPHAPNRRGECLRRGHCWTAPGCCLQCPPPRRALFGKHTVDFSSLGLGKISFARPRGAESQDGDNVLERLLLRHLELHTAFRT